jgi:hypothetical protein
VLGSHADEAVDVVGHDYIAANRIAAQFGLFGIGAECGVNRISGKNGFSVSGAEGHEVNRCVVRLENLIETVRLVRGIGHACEYAEKTLLYQTFFCA